MTQCFKQYMCMGQNSRGGGHTCDIPNYIDCWSSDTAIFWCVTHVIYLMIACHPCDIALFQGVTHVIYLNVDCHPCDIPKCRLSPMWYSQKPCHPSDTETVTQVIQGGVSLKWYTLCHPSEIFPFQTIYLCIWQKKYLPQNDAWNVFLLYNHSRTLLFE